jgi:hypothetical protein
MPEPGRPAGDSGYRYQDLVAALDVAEMARNDDVLGVWPEAFADVDDILVQRATTADTYAQVKEFSPGAEWTATTLAREGVLDQLLKQHRSTPDASLLLVTSSSARKLREAAQRARDSKANADGIATDHVEAVDLALVEWDKRLRADGVAFVASCRNHLKIDRNEALSLFASINVRDNIGDPSHLSSQLEQRLEGLVGDPAVAVDPVLRLVRTSAIARRRISRLTLRQTLLDAGIALISSRWAAIPDRQAYADEVETRLRRLDIAQLPELDRRVAGGGFADGEPLNLAAMPRRTVLIGAHGSGKSRIAADMARSWLEQGREGLHVGSALGRQIWHR